MADDEKVKEISLWNLLQVLDAGRFVEQTAGLAAVVSGEEHTRTAGSPREGSG